MQKNNLGSRLKQIRINLGLSLTEFAKKIDVSKSSVSLWENGKTSPSLEKLQKIAEIAGTSPAELMGYETQENKFIQNNQQFRDMVASMISPQIQKAVESIRQNPFVTEMTKEMEKVVAQKADFDSVILRFEFESIKLLSNAGLLLVYEMTKNPVFSAYMDLLAKNDPEYMARVENICNENGFRIRILKAYVEEYKELRHTKENK